MTNADRTIIREAGPFHITTTWHYGRRTILLGPLEKSWSPETIPHLAMAIGRMLDEAARPARKKGRRR